MYTYWDEELRSYLLTEEGKKLTERDMINIIGNLERRYDEDVANFVAISENRKDFATVDDVLWPEEDKISVPHICGWKLPL